MIQLCNAENQETADRTTQDSLKMQGLLEADNVPSPKGGGKINNEENGRELRLGDQRILL